MLKKLIDQLSQDIGPLDKNDDGTFSLQVEPDLHISLRENQESGITIYSGLAPLPEKRGDFLLLAMQANLFGRETGGNALGIDREGKHLTLTGFLPEGIAYREFHDYVEDFVNYAEAWRKDTIEFETEATR